MKILLAVLLAAGGATGLTGCLALEYAAGPGTSALLREGGLDPLAANGVVEGARPEIALRPEIIGTIKAVPFQAGRQATRGSVLVELADAIQKQQVALAEAELTSARACLLRVRNGERAEKRRALAARESACRAVHEKAKADWERARRLARTEAISAAQRDACYSLAVQAEADLKQATAERQLIEAPARSEDVVQAAAQVAAAEARLGLARAELARTRLTAPSDGCVLQTYAEPGELAGPTSPRPVLVFADLSRYRVRAFVDELDASRVRVGQRTSAAADGLPGKEFAGRVAAVLPRMGLRSPRTDSPAEYNDVHYREILIDLDSWDGLTLNLRVQVRIQADAGPAR